MATPHKTGVPTLLEILNKTADYLGQKGIENSRLDAQLLLGKALGLKRIELYLNYDRPLQGEELARCREWVKRRAAREPIQHILGEVSFRHIQLKTDKRALIPRRETELLVEHTMKVCRSLEKSKSAGAGSGDGLGQNRVGSGKEGDAGEGRIQDGAQAPGGVFSGIDVLEIGVGAGAVIYSLAAEEGAGDPVQEQKEPPEGGGSRIRLTGVEISEEALALCRENGAALNLLDGIELHHGDTFAPFDAERRWDVIVCNPPYVGKRELEDLAPEVKDWDPKVALVGGERGDEFPSQVMESSYKRLHSPGFLLLEIGADQGEFLKRRAESMDWKTATLHQDYSGQDRFLVLEKG